MDILKKYILIVCIAITVTILFAPIEWDQLQTPSKQRQDLLQNCIDENEHLTPRECTDLHPFDNIMTRPIINTTNWFDFSR